MPLAAKKAEETKVDFSKCKTTIGADPELMFQYRGQKVNAGIIFEGRQNNNNYNAKIDGGVMGTDHGDRVAEIRPKHGIHPKELVENIQKTLAKACMDYPTLASADWLAGARKHGETIGGHIHFGITVANWNVMNLSQALDIYLACPFMLLEPEEEARQRKGGTQYGKLGDIREQTWGTEYRPLSSWIYTPALALAVLSLAKHIVNQAVLNPVRFTKLRSEDVWGVPYTVLSQRYAEHNTDFFKKKMNDVWAEIMSWPVQPEVAEGLEIFKAMIDKGYTFGQGDFKGAWGLEFKTMDKKTHGVSLSAIFGG